MTLLEAVRDLARLDQEATIYAAAPWSVDSEVVVDREPEAGGLPIAAADRGMAYFLEVSIALEFLDGWPPASHRSACERLIQYAMFDA